jgi:hypothetical protein
MSAQIKHPYRPDRGPELPASTVIDHGSGENTDTAAPGAGEGSDAGPQPARGAAGPTGDAPRRADPAIEAKCARLNAIERLDEITGIGEHARSDPASPHRQMPNRPRRPDQLPQTRVRLGPDQPRRHRRQPDLDRTRRLRPQSGQRLRRITGTDAGSPAAQPPATRAQIQQRSLFRSK